MFSIYIHWNDVSEAGYVFYLYETNQFKGTKAVFQTSYLKMENMCLQIYYVLRGEGTKLTINAIHEEDRYSEEVREVVWLIRNAVLNNACLKSNTPL